MNISSIILFALSDNILLFAQIILMTLIIGKQAVKSRIAISSAIIIIFDFAFELIYGRYFLAVQYAVTAISSIKLSILTLYIFKTYNVRHILLLQIIQLTCSVINSGINAVFFPYNGISLERAYTLSLLIIRLCLLILSVITRKKSKTDAEFDKSKIIPTFVYVLIIIVIFIENGLTEGLYYPTSDYENKIRTSTFLLMLLIIFTTALIVSFTVNTAYKSHYLMLTNALKEQVKSQLSHYEKMEEINKEIRRFRHDYTNHINCIGNMIKGNKNEEALSYINNMSGKLPSDKFIIKTGNYIADAILTDKQEEAGKCSAAIEFEGCIIPEINSTDLCIILSNALDNAIEACRNISGDKKISVYGNFQQSCFVLIIKNPAQLAWTSSQGLPPSSKKDSANHGFGLSNIKSTVLKYNGNMNISTENGLFILSISFNPSLHG